MLKTMVSAGDDTRERETDFDDSGTHVDHFIAFNGKLTFLKKD